jgi:hypothetical protein
MYVIGKGHEHLGPGTSLVQFINWDQAQENEMRGFSGLGCADCGGGCKKGLGLFDGGMDVSTWGWPEAVAIGLGAYVLGSTVFTTGRAVSRVRAIPGERRKRRAAAYRAKAAELTKKR